MKLIPEIKKIVPDQNFCLLKYESLVSSPEAEIKKLCGVVEEKFESSMLEINYANSSSGTKSKGIFSSSTGKWKKELPPEHAYIGQQIAFREMMELEYTPEQLNIHYCSLWSHYFFTPFVLIRSLYANRDSRGALLPYLFIRFKAIISQK